jgi:hypothetical protein
MHFFVNRVFTTSFAVVHQPKKKTSRRVIVLRRNLAKDITISLKEHNQMELGLIETAGAVQRHEYAVLATTMQEET